MTRIASVTTLTFLCVAFTACWFTDSTNVELEPDVYEGLFAQGIEDSVFEPCGRDETWRLEFAEEKALQTFMNGVLEVLSDGANPMYVRLRGEPSEKGTYEGFFVTYDRTFDVREVLEVRAPRGADCL